MHTCSGFTLSKHFRMSISAFFSSSSDIVIMAENGLNGATDACTGCNPLSFVEDGTSAYDLIK